MMITLFSNEQINEFHDYQLKKEVTEEVTEKVTEKVTTDERQKTADIVNMIKNGVSAEEIAKTLDIDIAYVQMLASLKDTNKAV